MWWFAETMILTDNDLDGTVPSALSGLSSLCEWMGTVAVQAFGLISLCVCFCVANRLLQRCSGVD